MKSLKDIVVENEEFEELEDGFDDTIEITVDLDIPDDEDLADYNEEELEINESVLKAVKQKMIKEGLISSDSEIELIK